MQKSFQMSLIFFILAALFVSQNNCSSVYHLNLVDIKASTDLANSEGGGNGQGYDGKLTFVHTEMGFECEKHPAPKSIIRRTELGIWDITINELNKCASIDRQIITGVSYQSGQTFLNYMGVHFSLDNSMPEVPSSLIDLIQYFKVSSKVNPNNADVSPGDKICGDLNNECSLKAAVDESQLEENKITLINMSSGTYTISESLTLTSGTSINANQRKSTVAFVGEDPTTTIIDGNNTVVLVTIGNRTVEFLNLSLNRGKSNGASSAAIATYLGGSVYLFNCIMTNFNSPSDSLIDAGVSAGDVWIEKSKIFNNILLSAVRVFGAKSVTLSKSEVYNNSGWGIDVHNGSRNINILDSKIYSNQLGVHFRKCYTNCKIENSQITNNLQHGLYLEFSGDEAEDHLIRNTLVSGNAINSGANLYIMSNATEVYPLGPHFLRLENTTISGPASGHPNCLWGYPVLPISFLNSSADDPTCGF